MLSNQCPCDRKMSQISTAPLVAILPGNEFETRLADSKDSIAINILSPSNSIGKVSMIAPDEIASSRFLNLGLPFFTIPNILVSESDIVVIDHITSTQESAIPIEKIDAASYLTSTPSGLPDASDSSNRMGITWDQTRKMIIGIIVVVNKSTDINQLRSTG